MLVAQQLLYTGQSRYAVNGHNLRFRYAPYPSGGEGESLDGL